MVSNPFNCLWEIMPVKIYIPEFNLNLLFCTRKNTSLDCIKCGVSVFWPGQNVVTTFWHRQIIVATFWPVQIIAAFWPGQNVATIFCAAIMTFCPGQNVVATFCPVLVLQQPQERQLSRRLNSFDFIHRKCSNYAKCYRGDAIYDNQCF